jgi:hypothetical protein
MSPFLAINVIEFELVSDAFKHAALSDLPLVDITAESHDPRAERALRQLAALHRQLRLPTFVAGTAQAVVLARDLVRHCRTHI